MRRIWACLGNYRRQTDYHWMSVAEFNRSFTIEHPAAYVGQVRKILRSEALDYSEKSHFYRGLRNVFAEIDGMGKLYCGERGTGNTAENAIAFGIEFLGRVTPRYKKLFGLIVDMYRHGLAHTHVTKCFRFRDAKHRWITIGWAMSDEKAHRSRHLTVERKETRYFRLWLQVPRFVEDALKAIGAYRSDLEKAGTTHSPLFLRFKAGYIGTASVFQEPQPPSPSGKPPKKRSRRQRLLLKDYSAEGLTWLQNEISSGNAWTSGRV
jgi:hypothetical protein